MIPGPIHANDRWREDNGSRDDSRSGLRNNWRNLGKLVGLPAPSISRDHGSPLQPRSTEGLLLSRMASGGCEGGGGSGATSFLATSSVTTNLECITVSLSDVLL